MNVLVTSAFGIVGTSLLEHLDHRFTLLDVASPADLDGPAADLVDASAHDTLVADATDEAAVSAAMRNQDVVVHLARPSVPNEVTYSPGYEANLDGTTTVFGAAVDAEVDSIVYASSNHVVGGYEDEYAPDLYDPDHDLLLDHESPIRPDSMYAVTKAHGEALGRRLVEAHDVSVYALRIGSVRQAGGDHPYDHAESGVAAGRWERGSAGYDRSVARQKAMWQSRRDCAQLVDRCLRDESVDFGVFYGVSDNAGRWFDIERARTVLGYEPRDGGDEWDGPPNGE